MKTSFWKMNQLLALAAIFIALPAHAGPRDSGGGSGCLSEIFRSASTVSDWLETNGAKLSPPVKASDFLNSVDPSAIRFTQDDLQYQGNPVDAYFDGKFIRVRCDRLQRDSADAQNRVIAHEVFRKMGHEGDKYELSRQISVLSSQSNTHSEEQSLDVPANSSSGTCINLSLAVSNGHILPQSLLDEWKKEAQDNAMNLCESIELKHCRIIQKDLITAVDEIKQCADGPAFFFEAIARGEW